MKMHERSNVKITVLTLLKARGLNAHIFLLNKRVKKGKDNHTLSCPQL